MANAGERRAAAGRSGFVAAMPQGPGGANRSVVSLSNHEACLEVTQRSPRRRESREPKQVRGEPAADGGVNGRQQGQVCGFCEWLQEVIEIGPIVTPRLHL